MEDIILEVVYKFTRDKWNRTRSICLIRRKHLRPVSNQDSNANKKKDTHLQEKNMFRALGRETRCFQPQMELWEVQEP